MTEEGVDQGVYIVVKQYTEYHRQLHGVIKFRNASPPPDAMAYYAPTPSLLLPLTLIIKHFTS